MSADIYAYLPSIMSLAIIVMFRVYENYFKGLFGSWVKDKMNLIPDTELVENIALDCAMRASFVSAMLGLFASVLVLGSSGDMQGQVSAAALIVVVLFTGFLLWLAYQEPGSLKTDDVGWLYRRLRISLKSGTVIDLILVVLNLAVIAAIWRVQTRP